MGSKIAFYDAKARTRENLLDAFATIAGSRCLCRHQQGQRIRHNGNLGGQSSQQLSVSFNIDLSLSPGRLPRRTTDHLPARVQFNALHLRLTGKQSANDVSQICRATGRTKSTSRRSSLSSEAPGANSRRIPPKSRMRTAKSCDTSS